MRKFKYFLGIFAVLVAAGLVYGLFFNGFDEVKKLLTSTDAPVNEGTVAGAVSDDRKGLYAVTARAVVSPILSLRQNTVWYFDDQGQLYRSKFDGMDEQSFALSGAKPVKEVLWPPTGNDFIERQTAADGADHYVLYRSQSQSFIEIPSATEQLAWLPDGKRIVYVWKRGDGGRELKIGDPDASNYQKVGDLSEPYLLRPSPNGRYVLLIPFLSSINHKILKLDLDRQALSELVVDGKNVDVNIAPDGEKFLLSRISEKSGLSELWLYENSSQKTRALHIGTSSEKTVWAKGSDIFYYAIPESQFPSDPLLRQKSKDGLYAFTIASDDSSTLPYKFDSLRFDVRDLLILDSGQILFFRNGWDNRLYRLSIQE